MARKHNYNLGNIFTGKKYLYPFRAPFICNKRASPFALVRLSDDTEEILREFSENVNFIGNSASTEDSTVPVAEKENCQLLTECLKDADEVFKDVEDAIRQERDGTKNAAEESQPAKPPQQPPKGRVKANNAKPKYQQQTQTIFGQLYVRIQSRLLPAAKTSSTM